MNINGKKGFSILKMLIACIIILLFLFIVMWMIKKSTPNLDPIYDGIFRDNINTMQDAGEAYFTNDKLPSEVGQEVKITLQEMLDNNYILPFTDKNGDTCDLKNSYVLVVKTKDGYELRTYLKCGDESHQLVKVLGCHDLCGKDCNKEKVCTTNMVTQYQFVKEQTSTKNTYSCTVGKLNGKNCITTTLDVKPAKIKTSTKTDIKPASVTTSKKKLDTIVKEVKSYVPYEVITEEDTKEKKFVPYEVITEEDTKEKKFVPYEVKTTTKRIYTDPDKTVETNCKTVKEKDPNCVVRCVPTYVNGVLEDVCNTCGYVYHKKCTDTDVWICPNGYTTSGSGSSTTCYKDVPEETYKCPDNIKKENQSGSGKNLKCWYFETIPGKKTYKCPDYIKKENQSGSGENLKCWYFKVIPGKKTYKCPDYIKKENQSGSGENLKCWTISYNYSCPNEYNYSEGSGKNLTCYILTTTYSCDTASGWNLKEKSCYKTTTIKNEYCDSGYDLANGKCSKTITNTTKAEVKVDTITKKIYKWSKEETLSGWTRTGKTKEVKGKEVCE